MAPILIPKKPKPSSKHQTLNKTSDYEGGTPPSHSDGGNPLTPFIDRLSLVLPVSDTDDAHAIHATIWPNFKDTSVFKSGKAGGEFKVGKRIALNCISDAKKRPVLQYSYDKEAHKALKLRIEFVPEDLGLQGLTELHAVLISIVPGGWGYFIKHAHITRLDVTVDLPGVRIGGFLMMPPQALTSMQFWTNGMLTSITHGKPGGDQTLIYNRKQKRLSKKQAWAGATQTRVERRLIISGDKKLDDLWSLPNPFAKLQMIENMPGPPIGEDEKRWSMFEDSVEARGLVAALALLPVTRRTQYRKHLAAHPAPWWEPHAIWANWPKALNAMKIADPKAWT